jgi:hypothetical protein
MFGREPSNDYFISTKLCWNDPWVVPFHKCVRHFRPLTKMAATAELNLTYDPMGNGPSNDYLIKVWFQLSNWFQTRRCLCEFPIGSYVKLSSAVGAILVEVPNRRTHFWKRTIQWLFHLNQTLLRWFLGGPLPKLCPAFQNTDQDGRHSRTCNWPSGFWGEDFYVNFP